MILAKVFAMFELITNHPVALDSPDHLHPLGTINDNSGSEQFVQCLVNRGVRSLLDLGCAGGLLVRQANEAGIRAVGLEGSDINQRTKRAEWATIPECLFTCDVTKPFRIKFTTIDFTVRFDAITAWEFFEHISESDVCMLFEQNINFHSHVGTLLACSITCGPSPHGGVDLHQTQKPAGWWDDMFYHFGWKRDETIEQEIAPHWVRTGDFQRVYVRVA